MLWIATKGLLSPYYPSISGFLRSYNPASLVPVVYSLLVADSLHSLQHDLPSGPVYPFTIEKLFPIMPRIQNRSSVLVFIFMVFFGTVELLLVPAIRGHAQVIVQIVL